MVHLKNMDNKPRNKYIAKDRHQPQVFIQQPDL